MKNLKGLLSILIIIANGCSPSIKSELRVGMIPDKGSVEDQAFNQSIWEGLQHAENDFKAEITYLKPGGTSQSDFLKEISNLYDANYKIIVCNGYLQVGPVFLAQKKYLDAKFILIDELPSLPGEHPKVGHNTVAAVFSEHQAGFIAAVAAAAEITEGEFAFIGGMEVPPVQRFNWGFQRGVAYANTHLNTKITIKPENVIYQGTFYDIAAGQQLAAQLYNRGVEVIFTAAGAVGVGVINEAKVRSRKKRVWVVGVDSDQFAQGEYEQGKSVILTSAIKNVRQVVYDLIKAEYNGQFPGGQILVFNANNRGIGLPEVNPNLSKATLEKVVIVFEKLKTGEIQLVPVEIEKKQLDQTS